LSAFFRYFRYLLSANELMLALHLASELRCQQMCHMFINTLAASQDVVSLYLTAVAEQLCACMSSGPLGEAITGL
jgi:hypothetical protein